MTLQLECLLLENLLDLFLNILMFTETLYQDYKIGLMSEELRRIRQRPRVTTPKQDRFIHRLYLQELLSPSTSATGNFPRLQRISSNTVRRRLAEINLRPHRPVI